MNLKVDFDKVPGVRLDKAVVDGPELRNRPLVDNVHESARSHAPSADVDVMEAVSDRKSFATKLRMIILLSLVSWAALIAGIMWLVT